MVNKLSDWSIEEAERVYGVSQWGGSYFQIGHRQRPYYPCS